MKTHDMLDIANKMRTICSVEQKKLASKKLKASPRHDNTLNYLKERERENSKSTSQDRMIIDAKF